MKSFTILESEYFKRNSSDLFKKRISKSTFTDLSNFISGENNYRCWWTKTISKWEYETMETIEVDGKDGYADIDCKGIGCRPAIEFTELKDLDVNKTGKVLEIEYGEYPQDEVSSELANILNEKICNGTLRETGKKYILDKKEPFYVEYEYNDKRYIKYAKTFYDNHRKEYQEKWFEIKPIKWIVDLERKIAITEKVLISDIIYNRTYSFSSEKRDEFRYFERTFIKEFLDKSFAVDIQKTTKKINKNENPYDFNISQVTEYDLITQVLETDLPLFIHGDDSLMKDSLLKRIDEDYEVINLINANKTSINGYQNNKPSWLLSIENKCFNEPDKKHIVYFEDFDKGLNTLKTSIFDIAVKRKVNGLWDLPENAKIILSQDDVLDCQNEQVLKDEMSDFVHIFIQHSLDKWLIWASQNNIHPAIYSYLVYTEFQKENVNIDLKKWVMASKILDSTNNPNLLKVLIGEEKTVDFIDFSKRDVVSLDDVRNNTARRKIDSFDSLEILPAIYRLSKVDESGVLSVREIIKELPGNNIKLFDDLWCSGNEQRIMLIEKEKNKEYKKKMK